LSVRIFRPDYDKPLFEEGIAMNAPALQIDFVSDVSCPWCAIGLQSLQQALAKLPADWRVELEFQPFELNQDMEAEGEDVIEHLQRKYGASPEQLAQTQAAIAERGAQLGFTFAMDQRRRIYNTFDAHRLLHWAHEVGGQAAQTALKQALFKAYFSQGRNPSDWQTLESLAEDVGLDRAAAQQVLQSGAYADEVRAQQAHYRQLGIQSVPAVIVNGRHLIQGGQPPEVFERALREIVATAA
jgi:predicted DsbA family dithiol-disulfide isomerase